MRNIKRIIASILMLVVFSTFSIGAFAAAYDANNGGKYTFEIKADKTDVKVGDTIKVSFYVYGTAGEEVTFPAEACCFKIGYDSSKVSVKDYQTIDDTETCVDLNSTVIYSVEGKSVSSSATAPFFYVNFTANAEGSATFTLPDGESTMGLNPFYADNMPEYGEGHCADSITVTVTAGSTEPEYPYVDTEEVFTDGTYAGITTTAATKAVSVFGKAPEGGLKAGKYGAKVVSDGKTFKFAGIKDVEEGKVWVVKIISPDGTFTFSDETTVMATNAVSAYVD